MVDKTMLLSFGDPFTRLTDIRHCLRQTLDIALETTIF